MMTMNAWNRLSTQTILRSRLILGQKGSDMNSGRCVARLRSALHVLVLLGASSGPALSYGPFPLGTTVFVDASNTNGLQNGTSANPFNTIGEAINGAQPGAVVGVAPGIYQGTKNDELIISFPLELLGFDMKTTTIQMLDAYKHETLISIQSTNVRVSGFTINRSCDHVVVTPDNPSTCYIDEVAIRVDVADPTVRIERSVLTGNTSGIAVNRNSAGDGPTIDGVLITAHLYGINGPARVTNSVITSCRGVQQWNNRPITIVNNTFIGRDECGYPAGIVVKSDDDSANSSSGIIKNNIITAFNVGVWDEANGLPPLLYNVFYDNNYDAIVSGVGTLTTAGQINAIAGNAGNFEAEPKFVNTAADDLHLNATSPAIDAGDDQFAPNHDFDGVARPLDGDGNCKSTVDVGAFETAPKVLQPAEIFIHCNRYVFDAHEWVFAGCIAVDCCPFCPGRDVLDWLIRVNGDPVVTVVLRFEGLDPEAARRVAIDGRGQWIASDRLLMTGRELTLRGLPFPHHDSRSRVRMTVESFSGDQPLTGAFAVNVSQVADGRRIGETLLEYPASQSSGD
jgi:uncharacterized protein DUF1565